MHDFLMKLVGWDKTEAADLFRQKSVFIIAFNTVTLLASAKQISTLIANKIDENHISI